MAFNLSNIHTPMEYMLADLADKQQSLAQTKKVWSAPDVESLIGAVRYKQVRTDIARMEVEICDLAEKIEEFKSQGVK